MVRQRHGKRYRAIAVADKPRPQPVLGLVRFLGLEAAVRRPINLIRRCGEADVANVAPRHHASPSPANRLTLSIVTPVKRPIFRLSKRPLLRCLKRVVRPTPSRRHAFLVLTRKGCKSDIYLHSAAPQAPLAFFTISAVERSKTSDSWRNPRKIRRNS